MVLRTHLVVGFVLIYPLASAVAVDSGAVDYATFTKMVDAQHPEGSLDAKMVERARYREQTVGLLPDPRIFISREGAGIDEKREAASWNLRIEQMFPWPGVRAQEELVAREQVKTQDVQNQGAAVRRRFLAQETYVRYVTQTEQITNAEETLSQTADLLRSSENLLKVNFASHHDLIALQNEQTLQRLNVENMRNELHGLKDVLAQMVGKNDGSEIRLVATLPESLFAPEDSSTTAVDITKEGIEATSTLAEQRLTLERRRSWPDLSTELMVGKEDSGMMMYSAMIGIRIPLYSTISRNFLEEERFVARLQRTESLSWYERQKTLALKQNQRLRKTSKKIVEAIRNEVLPRVRAHVEVTTKEYIQGTGSLTRVIAAHRDLLRQQLLLITARSDLALRTIARQRIEHGLLEGASAQRPLLLGSTGMDAGIDMSSTGDGMGMGGTDREQNLFQPKPEVKPTSSGSPNGEEDKTMNGMIE